jgi:hypothetical protein
MGFGLNLSNGGSKDFLPIVKYDARAGRMFRVDKDGGVSTPVDITRNFKAVFDLANVEIGWMAFAAGTAPDLRLVPLGADLPEKPSANHNKGVRFLVKLSKENGGDVRELAGTSKAMLNSLEKLHDEYLAGLSDNPGKLPIVALIDTIAVESGSGQYKNTNYTPIFEIVGWSARPNDLVASPRGDSVAPAAPAARPAPPSTGSTRAAAPAPRAAVNDEEDFG